MTHSLIIPTSLEAENSTNLLESLRPGLENDEVIEVVVVVNGPASSTVGARDLPEVFSNPKIRVIAEPTGSLLAGRHRGVVETTGDVVSFLDDDVTVGPDWVSTLVEVFRDNEGPVLAGGPARPIYESDPPSWVEESFEESELGGRFSPFMSLLDLGDRDIVPIDPNLIWGLNFSVRRSALIDSGGFHPDLLPPSEQMFQGDGETGLTLSIASRDLIAGYFGGLAVSHRIPESRMSIDFLKKRAFYEGVGEQFAILRRQRISQDFGANEVIPSSSRFGPLKPLIDGVRARIPDAMARGDVQVLIDKYRLRGREYLARHYRRSPNVREWVHRDDYWDWKHPKP